MKNKGLSNNTIKRLEKLGKRVGKKLKIKNTIKNGIPYITISFEKD